jgi:hypothetical protein
MLCILSIRLGVNFLLFHFILTGYGFFGLKRGIAKGGTNGARGKKVCSSYRVSIGPCVPVTDCTIRYSAFNASSVPDYSTAGMVQESCLLLLPLTFL